MAEPKAAGSVDEVDRFAGVPANRAWKSVNDPTG